MIWWTNNRSLRVDVCRILVRESEVGATWDEDGPGTGVLEAFEDEATSLRARLLLNLAVDLWQWPDEDEATVRALDLRVLALDDFTALTELLEALGDPSGREKVETWARIRRTPKSKDANRAMSPMGLCGGALPKYGPWRRKWDLYR